MFISWRHLLAGSSLLFLLFLIYKMRPSLGRTKGGDEALRAARRRAQAAATPLEKAQALCDAGAIAASRPFHLSAAGYFLRAMRADPSWHGAIELAVAALARPRPRLLERMLWKRLADLPWDEEHSASLRTAALALRDLYDGRLRDRARAEFMRRFVDTL